MALPDIGAVVLDSLKSPKVRAALEQATGSPDRRIERSENGLSDVFGSLVQQAIRAFRAALNFGQWTFSTIIGFLHSAKNFIWNFNWNASDKELDTQIQSTINALAGMAGGALGNIAGYTTCGIIPSAGLAVIAPEVGLYLLKEVGEEAVEEWAAYAATLIRQTFMAGSQIIFTKLFQSNRSLFNGWVNGLGQALDLVVPGNLSWNQYREQRRDGQLVSFANFVEESIETLPPPLQAFFENFFEEAEDSCWEALYVVAGAADNWILQQRTAKEVILGAKRIVEVKPNRLIDSERIVLVGPENLVKTDLVTTLAHYQLLDNKDIGQFVGEPAEDYALAKRLGLRVKLVLYPYPEPPFYRGERIKPQQVTINVPDVIRSKLDYQTIRAACGGSNGYMWGEFRAIAHLDNGRQMHVYGASENEAEQQLKLFLTLSEAKIRRLSISKVKNEGEDVSNPSLKRLPRRVYPGHLTIWNRTELLSTVNAGRSGVRGNFFDKNGRIIIWPESKPFGFDKVIQEVLTRGVSGIS
jgi:hypothetical protein